MRNRFNINESEKNRIRILHGMQVINEQDSANAEDSQTTEKELAWGTGQMSKTTPEFVKTLLDLVRKQIAAISLVGQTVNLYLARYADDNDAGEGKVVGNFTLQSVELAPLPEKGMVKGDIVITLKFKGPKGDLETQWSCGWKYMRVVKGSNADGGYNLGKDVETYHDNNRFKVVTNDKFINSLQKSECPPIADFSADRYKNAPFTELTWMARADYGGGFKIVEAADFASNDEIGDDVGSGMA